MKKTLKHAIAASLISSLVLSGITAFAFTDFEDTERSVLLQKTGVISGYEDGSFRPQKDVTRAEAAKLIIKATGWTDEDIASYSDEMSRADFIYAHGKNILGFDDYNPKHWANVYIQMAMENDIIAGFDDNTFRPDDNVTIEQLLTMLVNATGYDTYAQAMGGYPDGYMQWAASLGMTNSLTGTDLKKTATRAEAVTCVSNAMDAPLCVIDSYTTQWDGTIAPSFAVKDGKGKDWQTLLTGAHEIYTATGAVTYVNDTEFDVRITDSPNFMDMFADKDNPVEATIKLGEYASKDFEKNKSYKFYIRLIDFDNKEYELVCAFPAE